MTAGGHALRTGLIRGRNFSSLTSLCTPRINSIARAASLAGRCCPVSSCKLASHSAPVLLHKVANVDNKISTVRRVTPSLHVTSW